MEILKSFDSKFCKNANLHPARNQVSRINWEMIVCTSLLSPPSSIFFSACKTNITGTRVNRTQKSADMVFFQQFTYTHTTKSIPILVTCYLKLPQHSIIADNLAVYSPSSQPPTHKAGAPQCGMHRLQGSISCCLHLSWRPQTLPRWDQQGPWSRTRTEIHLWPQTSKAWHVPEEIEDYSIKTHMGIMPAKFMELSRSPARRYRTKQKSHRRFYRIFE